jgi:hypothetical protein
MLNDWNNDCTRHRPHQDIGGTAPMSWLSTNRTTSCNFTASRVLKKCNCLDPLRKQEHGMLDVLRQAFHGTPIVPAA